MPRLRIGAPLVACLTVAMLAACNTSQDPARGGFVSGISGLASGSYEERRLQKETELKREQARAQQLREEQAATETEREAAAREREAAERRLSALAQDLDRLDHRLQEALRDERADGERIGALRGEVADLERQRRLLAADPVATGSEKARRLSELEERKAALERALTAALGA